MINKQSVKYVLSILLFFSQISQVEAAKYLDNGLPEGDTKSSEARFTISGFVKDATDGEALIGVSVYIHELKTGTVTNSYGFYSISLSPGDYAVHFSYIGYKSIQKNVSLNQNQTVNIDLPSEEVSLQEVVVKAERPNANVEKVEMSTTTVSMVQIKQIPQFMGEVDIIRSLLLLPGVTTVGEGATGFNVRGGNVDENLILLDEAPVYNASHVFGFFSVFNADAVKDMKIYKGGIPATYGGRLSSVLDVRQKEGNMKKFAGEGGLGLISSRLLLEGPIKKDKSSFMVAGRRSYADVFTRLSSNESIKDNVVYFYDLNSKINYVINERNRIYLSGYFGRDVLTAGNSARLDWGNNTGTIRWNHVINSRLFSNVTAVYSDYDYTLSGDSQGEKFKWTSSILNTNLKADFSYYMNPNNTLAFGINALSYRFEPGDVSLKRAGESDVNFNLRKKRAVEPAIYISNEQTINQNLSLQYGLRYSRFYNVGKGSEYVYGNQESLNVNNIVDTVEYKGGEVIKSYGAFEPRFSAKYTVSPNSSIKMSYNRMAQYIHLVSNTTAALPIDIWAPSGKYIKPARVDQFTVGYFRNFNDDALEFSAEIYYKNYKDLLDYKDGAELLFNDAIETEIINGKGRAYGLELLLRKQEGQLTGWVGYTLSRTERKVPGINNNDFYPSNYDKLHDLSVVANYTLNPKWSLSSNITFMTGRPVTYPNAQYVYEGIVVPNYDNRNGARTPAYHRLDVSATYVPNKNPDKKWTGSWTFSIYNAYGRRNPFSIYFRQNEDNPAITEAVRYSVFGSIIPSVTYNFKF